MWIVPSTCSVSAPATEGLNWDSGDWGYLCERSLTWRGRDSQSRTWSSRWKRVPWMRLLSLRTLRPSHTDDFLDAWISSLPVTRANRSAQRESGPARTTRVTSGHGSQMELPLADPDGSSSKTSKDTFRWDSPQSSATWKKWVTERRGEYSARLKSAHRTNGKESLSLQGEIKCRPSLPRTAVIECPLEKSENGQIKNWPTLAARGVKGKIGKGRQERKGHPTDTLPNAVAQWPTPAAHEARLGFQNRNNGKKGTQKSLTTVVIETGHPDRENPSTNGKNPEQWRTLSDPSNRGGSQPEEKRKAGGHTVNLEGQVHQTKGKLNPNWVEQLMGLPVGWTQLSTAWTDCDCSETESSPPPQAKPSQPSTTN